MGTVADTVTAHLKENKDDIGCVIATFNFDISVTKMALAVSYLDDPNVLFVGTNRDARFPFDGGIFLPGNDFLISFLA